MPFPAAIADELAALMVGKGRDDLVFTDCAAACCVTQIGGRGCSNRQWPRAGSPTSHSRRSHRTTFGTRRHRLADQRWGQREGGAAHARAREGHMTLDVYADLFDADLDDVAVNLDAAIRAAADAARSGQVISLPVREVWGPCGPLPGRLCALSCGATAGRLACQRLPTANRLERSKLRFSRGAKGIRTPDLLDANESRYQLRHSPWSVAQATSQRAPAETGRCGANYCPAALGRS